MMAKLDKKTRRILRRERVRWSNATQPKASKIMREDPWGIAAKTPVNEW